MYKCQECGRKFKTTAAAQKAMFGDSGCPKCGGSDIDIDPTAPATPIVPVLWNSPSLVIRNVDSLPRGTGAKFLLCVRGQPGELVAKKWCRKLPAVVTSVEVVVGFRS